MAIFKKGGTLIAGSPAALHRQSHDMNPPSDQRASGQITEDGHKKLE